MRWTSKPSVRAALAATVLLGALSGPALGTTDTISASNDTWVWSATPDNNIGSSSVTEVGRTIAKTNQVLLKRALLHFDVSALPPDAMVTAASLRLSVEGTSEDPLNLELTVWRLASGFSEGDGTSGVTWNTQPDVEPAPVNTATMDAPAGDWFAMDVTDVVVAERASADPNHVWLRVAATDETTVELRDVAFRSREHGTGADAAQLVITYGSPTPTATWTVTATGTPTATPTPTPDLDPPVIVITSPADEARLGEATVLVTGTVRDASALASLTVNAIPLTPSAWFSTPVALAPGANTITVEATDAFNNTGAAEITVRRDQTPVLAAIGNQTVALGQTLTLALSASDPDGDALTFQAAPLPLPATATLNAATGVFRYTPTVNEAGTVQTVEFAVSDGLLRDTETVTITVGPWPTSGPTALSGRLLDATDAANNIETPIVGATVRRIPSGPSTTTAPDGTFTLSGLVGGLHYIEFDGSTAVGPVRYGGYRAQEPLIPHITTTIERPIYLPRIDTTGEVIVDPNSTTVVSNPNLGPPPGVTLTIPPHTVKNESGQDYAGPLSISEVPATFTPGALPDTLEPGLVITVQPMGLTFANPVPVSFPNLDALRPASQVNLWSLDHTAGQFFIAGTGQARTDGTAIDTIDGGIREASWHFLLPVNVAFSSFSTSPGGCASCGSKSASGNGPECGPSAECALSSGGGGSGSGGSGGGGSGTGPASDGTVAFGSVAQLATGNVGTGFSLPRYQSVGRSRGLTFTYSSIAAHPAPVISFDAAIPGIAALPPVISYALSLGNLAQGGATFTETSALVDGLDQSARVAAQLDAQDLPTGVYPLTVRVTSVYPASRVSGVTEVPVVHVNHRASPFGAGWTLFGLDRLIEQPDQSVLITQGNGVAWHFLPAEPQRYETLIEGDGPLAYFRLGESEQSGGGCQAAREEVGGNLGVYRTLSATDWSCGVPGAIAADDDTAVYLAGTGPDTNIRHLDLTALPLAQRQALGLARVDAFTLEIWVRFTEYELPVALMSAWSDTSYGASQYRLSVTDQGRPACAVWRFGAGAPDEVVGPTALADDQWHHLVCRYDSLDAVGDGLEVFVDGQRVAGNGAVSGETNEFWQDARVRCQAGGLKRCGVDNGGSGGCQAACCPGANDAECESGKYLDEAAWYGRAFTDAEILAHAQAGSAAVFPAPTGAYASPDGETSTLVKNADGTFTRTLRDGTRVDFDAAGLQTAVTDRYDNTTTYEYNASEQLIRLTEPGNRVTTLDYLGAHLQQVTDPANRVTTFAHDPAGNLVRVVFPDGSTRAFGYDGRHLMTAETDGRLFTTSRSYDFAGLAAEARLPDGSVRRVTPAKTVGLVNPASGLGTEANPAPLRRSDDAVGTFTDGENRTWTAGGGPLGLPQAITGPAGLTTTYERDDDGNPRRVVFPSGQAFTRTYDTEGHVLTVTDEALNGTTTFTYHPVSGQITSVTDAADQLTVIDPNANGDPETITTPEGRVTTITYTSRGLPERITDVFGTVTFFTYDPVTGVLRSVLQGENLPPAEQRLTQLVPTAEGYVDLLTDAENRVTDATYDPLGRVTSQLLPGPRAVGFEYDDAGNLTALTPPGRPPHGFAYTPVNLEERYDPPQPEPPLADPTTAYTYNDAQQLVQVDRPDGAGVTYGYDPTGRLETVTVNRVNPPSQDVHTYVYHPQSGLLDTITIDTGGVLAFGYVGERLASETWSGTVAGSVSRTVAPTGRLDTQSVNGTATVTFAYDDDGLLTGVLNPLPVPNLSVVRTPATGFIDTTSLGAVSDAWTPTPFGELDTYTATAAAVEQYAVDYERDRLGRITQKTEAIAGEPAVVWEYSYHPEGWLKDVRRDGQLLATYTYDDNGNRLTAPGLSTTPVYDDQDRLLEYGGTTYTYTGNGELASQAANGQTTTYTYDPLGNLRTVVLPGPSPTTIEYIVDARNRRVGKRVNGQLVQGLLYQDQLNPVAELDGQNRVVRRFVYGTKPNVPDYVIQYDAAGQPTGISRIISDHLGSPRLVLDTASGAILQRLDYDAWGTPTLVAGTWAVQPFGFAGGLSDPDTGLLRFGWRDYDPLAGRWLQRDPIGFRGGDPNLYPYTFNDPINLVDPSGLQTLPPPSGPPSGQIDWYAACIEGPANQSFPGGTNDKFKHCIVTCDICKLCGPLASGAAAIGKEVQDIFGPGDASVADLIADAAGVQCGGQSSSCPQCCHRAGYSP